MLFNGNLYLLSTWFNIFNKLILIQRGFMGVPIAAELGILQICLNFKPVSTCLNFGLIYYFIETQVQQPKIIETGF